MVRDKVALEAVAGREVVLAPVDQNSQLGIGVAQPLSMGSPAQAYLLQAAPVRRCILPFPMRPGEPELGQS